MLSFNWSYGDGGGSFVSNNPVSSHTYTLLGNFSLNLTIKAAILGPCPPVTTTSLPTTQRPTTTMPRTTALTTSKFTSLGAATKISVKAEVKGEFSSGRSIF